MVSSSKISSPYSSCELFGWLVWFMMERRGGVSSMGSESMWFKCFVDAYKCRYIISCGYRGMTGGRECGCGMRMSVAGGVEISLSTK